MNISFYYEHNSIILMWLKELKLFFYDTRIEVFSQTTQRTEPFLFEHDSKNWTFLMWLKELKILNYFNKWAFFEYDSQFFLEIDPKN